MKLNKLLEAQIQSHAKVLNGDIEKLNGFFKVISDFYDTHENAAIDKLLETEKQKRETAELELKRREAFFQSLIENSHDGIVLLGADGKIKYVSPSVSRILGYTTKELIGTDPITYMHPADIEYIVGILNTLIPQYGKSEQALYRMKDVQGNWRWIHSNITNLLHEPNVQAIVFNYKDNTERIKAESELRHLFENIQDVFFSVDTIAQKQLQISPACLKVYGYPQEDFFKDPDLWFKIILEEDKPIVMANYPLMQAGKSFVQVYRIRHGNGSIRWFESKIFPTLEEGIVVRIDGVTTDITEKKIAAEKLDQSRAHLVTSQHIASIGSWEIELNDLVTMANNPVYWSDETYLIFGFEPGEIPPSTEAYFDIVHLKDKAKVWRSFSKTLKNGEVLTLEHRIVLPNGIEKIIFGRSEIIKSPTGKPLKVIGTVHDITERKKAEIIQKQTEANFRNILENTDTSYVLLDRNANILEFNRLATELAAVEMGVALQKGDNYIDMMLDSRKDEVRQVINTVLNERREIVYEVKYPHTDGEDNWLYVRMHPIINTERNILGLSVAATNITHIKNAEKLIKESNFRYEMMSRATNDIVWDWDIESEKIYRSENYGVVLGYPQEDDGIYVDDWVSHIHPDDSERVYNHMENTINDPEKILWEDEYRYFRSNGDIAYIHDRGHILRDHKGKAIRLVGAMSDITAKKLAAIEHEKITSDLLQRNKDLEQFAYIVSHNLRAPVANIIGYADALSYDDLGADERKIFNQGLSISVQRLDGVITDLNHILQVKRNISELKVPVQFSKLVSDIVSSLENTIKKESVQVVTDFEEIDEIDSLKSYIYSIFYNLISNSIKYRRADANPVLNIASRKTESGVVLTFNDNGLGIDLTKKSHQVFGLYKRFHLHVEGKGMGLFMTKTQVETLGGKIYVQSEVGKGTTFTIQFTL